MAKTKVGGDNASKSKQPEAAYKLPNMILAAMNRHANISEAFGDWWVTWLKNVNDANQRLSKVAGDINQAVSIRMAGQLFINSFVAPLVSDGSIQPAARDQVAEILNGLADEEKKLAKADPVKKSKEEQKQTRIAEGKAAVLKALAALTAPAPYLAQIIAHRNEIYDGVMSGLNEEEKKKFFLTIGAGEDEEAVADAKKMLMMFLDEQRTNNALRIVHNRIL